MNDALAKFGTGYYESKYPHLTVVKGQSFLAKGEKDRTNHWIVDSGNGKCKYENSDWITIKKGFHLAVHESDVMFRADELSEYNLGLIEISLYVRPKDKLE